MSRMDCPIVELEYLKAVGTAYGVKGVKGMKHFRFFFFSDSWVSLWGRISRLPKQPCWLCTQIALQQHSPLPRMFYTSENWLSSRNLTSVIILYIILFKLGFFILANTVKCSKDNPNDGKKQNVISGQVSSQLFQQWKV